MEKYKKEFLDFALKQKVLRFGEFTLKSGRVSPYFFNSGLFNTGGSLSQLGKYYAKAAIKSDINFDLVFGPAYKGIPLAAITAVALAEDHECDLPYAFNRKEAKDHGEGGHIVGASIEGKNVLIVDDVISAGISVRESVDIIAQNGGKAVGVLIALDRQERGSGEKSTLMEIEEELDIRVTSIVNMTDLMHYLEEKGNMQALEQMQKYRQKYGA